MRQWAVYTVNDDNGTLQFIDIVGPGLVVRYHRFPTRQEVIEAIQTIQEHSWSAQLCT